MSESTPFTTEWIAVDVSAEKMAGASYCQGCYVLEVLPHDEGPGWAKPHGPDCSCSTPVWMLRSDAEDHRLAQNKYGPIVVGRVIADVAKRNPITGRAITRYGDTVDDLRGQLSGWHFAKESLTSEERQMLYVAEQLMSELDRIAGGYFQ